MFLFAGPSITIKNLAEKRKHKKEREGKECRVPGRVSVCRHGETIRRLDTWPHPRYWVEVLPQSVRHSKSSSLRGVEKYGVHGFCLFPEIQTPRPHKPGLVAVQSCSLGLEGCDSSVPSEIGPMEQVVCVFHPITSLLLLRCPGRIGLPGQPLRCAALTGLAGEMKDRFYFRHECTRSRQTDWLKYVGIPISLPFLLPRSVLPLHLKAWPPPWDLI